MTRRIATYLSLISVAVLATGCALISAEALDAKSQVLTTNAEGLEKANKNFLLKIDDLAAREEAVADEKHFRDILKASDGTTLTMTIKEYLDERAGIRASVKVVRDDWMLLLAEYVEAAKTDRNMSVLTEREAALVRRANALTGATSNGNQ